jgi:hypothetical protein
MFVKNPILGHFHKRKKRKGLASVCLDKSRTTCPTTTERIHFLKYLYDFSYSHLSRVYLERKP